MAVNDYVMVSPQVSHYSGWAKGQIIEGMLRYVCLIAMNNNIFTRLFTSL